jgi:DNA-binding beta-propeller fold protein YncE
LGRRNRRKIILIVLLVLLLLFLSVWFWNFKRTRSLSVAFAPTTPDAIPTPTYLFSFGGSGNNKMYGPIGIAISGNRVFVTDAPLNTVLVFDRTGKFIQLFKQKVISRIEYVTVNPVTGNLYVGDRGKKQVEIFSQSGAYLGIFDPKLPKNQLPKFKADGKQWDPTIVAFAPDGAMYAIEVLNGHRVLKFDNQGHFVKSVGDSGFVKNSSEGPGIFQFPNGLVVHNGLVYVADSNNRRVQVFDSNLNFKQFIVTSGLPRGIDFLNRTGMLARGKDKFVTSDTLSHDVSIWTNDGKEVATFGQQGALEAQFEYPNQLAVDSQNQIFVTDTQNGRVQVWGWPSVVLPAPPKIVSNNAWFFCALPLLFIPILILRRKRKVLVSREFVLAIVDRGQATSMSRKRFRWLAMPEDYEVLKSIEQDSVDFGELLEETEYSDSDMRAIRDRLEVPAETAAILAVAQRTYLFCTEDAELRRLAKSLDAEVVNVDEYLDRFGPKR